MKSGAGVSYTYDGDGDRLEKSSGKIYWYGAGTEILDESDLSGNFTNEYVFFGGKRIAMRNVSTNTIYYYAEDMLGSSRTIVQAGQTTVCFDADFYPFGGERDITTTCSSNYKFEGKERDTETNNDDFGARYYSWRYGRWLSADYSDDPEPVPYANFTNPQTLNLYAMVDDDPESFGDLDGHGGCGVGGSSTGAAGCMSGMSNNVVAAKNGVTPAYVPSHFQQIVGWLKSLWFAPAIGGTSPGLWQPQPGIPPPSIPEGTAAGAGAEAAEGGTAAATTGAGASTATWLGPIAITLGALFGSPATAVPSQDEIRPDLERTPDTHPGDFEHVKNTPAKRNKTTNEIWERDRLHKNHWEVYKNKRNYENGKRDRAVWNDGRLEEKF